MFRSAAVISIVFLASAAFAVFAKPARPLVDLALRASEPEVLLAFGALLIALGYTLRVRVVRPGQLQPKPASRLRSRLGHSRFAPQQSRG